jgi:hypothetical protein
MLEARQRSTRIWPILACRETVDLAPMVETRKGDFMPSPLVTVAFVADDDSILWIKPNGIAAQYVVTYFDAAHARLVNDPPTTLGLGQWHRKPVARGVYWTVSAQAISYWVEGPCRTYVKGGKDPWPTPPPPPPPLHWAPTNVWEHPVNGFSRVVGPTNMPTDRIQITVQATLVTDAPEDP